MGRTVDAGSSASAGSIFRRLSADGSRRSQRPALARADDVPIRRPGRSDRRPSARVCRQGLHRAPHAARSAGRDNPLTEGDVYRFMFFSALMLAQATSSKCGSSEASTVNTQAIIVNAGPANTYFNGAFTNVVICVPGTNTCQTISGILIDTGSTGLRVLSSALTLPLPQQTGSGGAPVAECYQFVDGFTWGPLQMADITLAGEQARNTAVQVIGSPGFSNIPAGCLSTGVPEDTLADLGANGILGVGLFRQDCGLACTFPGSSNPGLYYVCASGSCAVTTQALAQQVQNPVWLFASDNNGIGITLPSVPAGGLSGTMGMIRFGIGTQSDNSLGSSQVQTTDAAGNFTTIFNGQAYGSSFIDSGSNGLYLLDTSTTGLPTCSDAPDFYCPLSLTQFSATNRGANGAAKAVGFQIGNADALSETFTAFSEIGGPNPGLFDWGLPFFYGRTVFVAIEGQSTPGGVGPYWAY